jgi:hypothetical protein
MFNKKELLLIRKVIDDAEVNTYYTDKKQEEIMNLRDKCTDLLVLQKQWKKKQNLCDLV